MGVVRDVSEKYLGVVASFWALLPLVIVVGRGIALERHRIVDLLDIFVAVDCVVLVQVVSQVSKEKLETQNLRLKYEVTNSRTRLIKAAARDSISSLNCYVNHLETISTCSMHVLL